MRLCVRRRIVNGMHLEKKAISEIAGCKKLENFPQKPNSTSTYFTKGMHIAAASACSIKQNFFNEKGNLVTISIELLIQYGVGKN